MSGAAVFLALAAATAQSSDTTVELRRGDRVVIEELSGEISVSTWDRDAIEVVDEDGAGGVSLRRRGGSVIVGVEGRRRRRSAEASVRIPSWVDIEVGSPSLDVTIRGVDGVVTVGTVRGDVVIEDVGGAVDVRSISGEIRVTDARGRVSASSQSDDVTLRRVSGPVEVHSGDGNIRLDDLQSTSVRAEARDGDIVFTGAVAEDGDYGFFLHDGDATVTIPASTSARVSVSTFSGEFQSDFTVRVGRFTSGRQFDFVLGDGDARIQIEVFDGDISLRERR
jgi:DUF4097 and DUF4098 domain-containing protein YvlB